jgi:hypothetical protein
MTPRAFLYIVAATGRPDQVTSLDRCRHHTFLDAGKPMSKSSP